MAVKVEMNELVSTDRALRYVDYADAVGEGEVVSRSMMAQRMGVCYSTAMYHLERASSEGLLNKAYGYVGDQPGWVYAHPLTMPRLEGVDSEEN